VDLAIVIVTHDSNRVIRPCLESIGPSLRNRVTVVDNGSTDGTLATVRRVGIQVLVNDSNQGYGRAANLGATQARAEHLCFMNPDCEATPELFITGVETLLRAPGRCAVPMFDEGGPRLIEGRQPGYTRLKLVEDVLHSNYGDSALCRWLRARPGYHDHSWSWPYGACFFIRRTHFLDLGGFDTRYFLYMEDVDLGRRLCRDGGEVVGFATRVRHALSHGAHITRRRRQALLNEGRCRYAALQYGRPLAVSLAALVGPSAAWRVARERFS
jgi:N-acetylglucosaminyl-diphospho-decaprenol L-rhamnosyltransferase